MHANDKKIEKNNCCIIVMMLRSVNLICKYQVYHEGLEGVMGTYIAYSVSSFLRLMLAIWIKIDTVQGVPIKSMPPAISCR